VIVDLEAWRPDMEGILDDVKLWVDKLDPKHAQVVFDTLPHSGSPLLPSASAGVSTTVTADPTSPMGHGSATTTRDVSSRVIMT
jgi:hypothetical protein